MPNTPSRLSSVGPDRRGLLKHLPYRGDRTDVGKKTGIEVARIPRGNDGFEDFDQLISQTNNNRNNEGRKRKSLAAADDGETDEEDGVQDMDVDTPIAYISNSRTINIGTPSRSSRPAVSRLSEVNFDDIPSTSHSHSRQSKSRYRPSSVSPEPNDDDDDDDELDIGRGRGGDRYDHDQPSFQHINHDDDDDPHPPDDNPPLDSPPISRIINRERTPGATFSRYINGDDDDDDDAELMNGLDDIDQRPPSSPEPPPPRKLKEKKPRKKKENRIIIHEDPAGVRRSKRQRYGPLDWWRGEKVVYGGGVFVPHITEIVRIPAEPLPPLGKHNKKKFRARSRTVDPQNPERGWDDDTNGLGIVRDYRTNVEKEMRIAVTAAQVKPKQALNDEWSFDKLFSEEDFVAAGQLHIPPHGKKPSKATKDNAYMFFVAEGAITVKINDEKNSFVLCSGGQFCVPRGNTYYLENISDRTAKLFFTQARRIGEADDGNGGPSGRASSASVGSSPRKTPTGSAAVETE